LISRSLTDNNVDIWLIEPHLIAPETVDSLKQTITDAELIRATAKRGATAQRDAIITRALIRLVLSQYQDIEPLNWGFEIGFNGKPYISDDDFGLSFNLSHATNLIACAVTRHHDIGIDVEYTKRASDTYKLAPRYFSPQEVEALQALPYEQQAIDFYHYWTLKEAYIKACGDGLAIPLNHFSFTIDNELRAAISFSPQRNDQPQHWQHSLYQPTSDHKMGLSVRVADTYPLTITTHQLTNDRLLALIR